MDLDDLKIPPGAVTLQTERGAGARWVDMDKVRFANGLPQKIGGWTKVLNDTFVGKCRGLMDWVSLAFAKYVAIGTSKKLYVFSGGALYDITPIRSTVTLGANPFSMTDTSAVVRVTHAAHGAIDGSYVTFSGASAAGGITISGEYVIDYVDADHYDITHSAPATSTTTGGGAAVSAAYQINIGGDDSVYGLGWGVGTFGSGTFGTPRSSSSIIIAARVWSLDNWGEDLIACPRGGGIYVWDASAGTSVRATVISGAPSTAKFVFVSDDDRHLVALGAHDGSADDPLNVRWSDTEDYDTFTATEENTAGDKRLSMGNELYSAVKTKSETVIFGDLGIWQMLFTGAPYTYQITSKGRNGGIMGPNAAVEKDGRVYWMAWKDFYVYDGAVNKLECLVHNHVFDDISFVQKFKVHGTLNRLYGEIWWFYCSEDSSEIDRYVVLNPEEKTWVFGTLVRTAIVGDPDVFDTPIAAGADGYLYYHETGVDADAGAMATRLKSGGVELGDGDFMMFVKRLVPDFKVLTGSVTITLKAKRYPQSSEEITGTPLTITSTTEEVNPRIRGRQVSFTIESSDVGDDWRLGGFRIGARPDGRR